MRRNLNELEAGNLLTKYGIPMVKSAVSHSEEDAKEKAEAMDFPVVMKILSSDILHKTEAGCVITNITDAKQVKEAYCEIIRNAQTHCKDATIEGVLIQEMAEKGLEVIVGMKHDPQFGPVILAGTGGIYVEVFEDISLRLLPITRQEAKAMLEETKLIKILRGARGTVYDEDALIDILLRLSDMALVNPLICEIDVNPLFLYETGKGAKGVDALIVTSDSDTEHPCRG